MLILYFLLTFGATWLAWIAPVHLAEPAASSSLGPGGPLFRLGVVAPGLVALVLTALLQGRDGVLSLLDGIRRWNVAPRFYLFAAGYMVAIKLGAAVVHRWWAGAWPAVGETPLILLLLATIPSTVVQAGEEVGWRGYALPRLAARVGLGGATIVLGIVWATWHLPLFLIPGSGSDGQSFPLYLLHVLAFSVAIGWLYWKTGSSLLLVMLMHAAINNTAGIVPGAIREAAAPFAIHGSIVAWATVALAWAIAIPLLVDMRGARLADPISTALASRRSHTS
jgi:membrane protease YdiL (CAAX protease family)